MTFLRSVFPLFPPLPSLYLSLEKKKKTIRICMIFNSKLKPLSQKNEYLFRYINKKLQRAASVREKKFCSHSFFGRLCAYLSFGKVSHFNIISVCRFPIQEMVQIFLVHTHTAQFSSARYGLVWLSCVWFRVECDCQICSFASSLSSLLIYLHQLCDSSAA